MAGLFVRASNVGYLGCAATTGMLSPCLRKEIIEWRERGEVRSSILRTYLGPALACFSGIALAAASPPYMPASKFLKQADALRARLPFALLSPDLKRLQAEAERAGDELHKEHAAAISAAQPTDYCSPVSKYLAPRELIVGLHALPEQELQRMDIRQAMRAIFVHNYPCQKTARR